MSILSINLDGVVRNHTTYFCTNEGQKRYPTDLAVDLSLKNVMHRAMTLTFRTAEIIITKL